MSASKCRINNKLIVCNATQHCNAIELLTELDACYLFPDSFKPNLSKHTKVLIPLHLGLWIDLMRCSEFLFCHQISFSSVSLPAPVITGEFCEDPAVISLNPEPLARFTGLCSSAANRLNVRLQRSLATVPVASDCKLPEDPRLFPLGDLHQESRHFGKCSETEWQGKMDGREGKGKREYVVNNVSPSTLLRRVVQDPKMVLQSWNFSILHNGSILPFFCHFFTFFSFVSVAERHIVDISGVWETKTASWFARGNGPSESQLPGSCPTVSYQTSQWREEGSAPEGKEER